MRWLWVDWNVSSPCSNYVGVFFIFLSHLSLLFVSLTSLLGKYFGIENRPMPKPPPTNVLRVSSDFFPLRSIHFALAHLPHVSPVYFLVSLCMTFFVLLLQKLHQTLIMKFGIGRNLILCFQSLVILIWLLWVRNCLVFGLLFVCFYC